MKTIKHLLLMVCMFHTCTIFAQNESTSTTDAIRPFNHLDLGLTAGSTGIGLELATPINKWMQVRTGFSYMPNIHPIVNFGVQVGDDPTTSQSKFEKMSDLLEGMVGHEVKNSIDMEGDPNFYHWNVMVDFFPFKNNRHWHITAGFFLGPSTVATAYNTTEDMTSLIAVDMYNNMYEYFTNETYIDQPIYGEMFIDPEIGDRMKAKLERYGRMGMPMGKYKHDITDAEGNIIHAKGDPYIMMPDENSMVRAKIKVNSFKPYLGVGYKGKLSKKDDRLHIAFDGGVMMWGGTPSLITHDGTDLINDVVDVPGKIGKYCDAISSFKVYPVLNLRLIYRLY